MSSTLPGSDGADWVARAFAEIDYGIVVVDASHDAVYCNPIAHRCLTQRRGLQLDGNRLVASNRAEQKRLDDALEGVLIQGYKKMVVLGDKGQRIGVSVVPVVANLPGGGPPKEVSTPGHAASPRAMLMLSRQRLVEPLSVYAFARDHQLTLTEHKVLLALCRGMKPQEIADDHGSSLYTVRAQIISIRAKTFFDSVGELLGWISTLPPVLLSLECQQV